MRPNGVWLERLDFREDGYFMLTVVPEELDEHRERLLAKGL